jgi:transposase
MLKVKVRLDRDSILNLRRIGLTGKGIATALGVCQRTILRWTSEKRTNRRKAGRPKKITNAIALRVLASLRNNPFQTQHDIVCSLASTTKVHQSTISRFLRQQKWTWKKVTKKPCLGDEAQADAWLKSISGQKIDDFLALDETSFVTTNTSVTHGYTPRGTLCLFQQKQRNRRDRLTLLICIQPSNGEVVHQMIVEGSVNAVLFQKFIQELPATTQNKRLILDNARIHHATKACQTQGLPTIQETAAMKKIDLVFIPPYSPQLNPTELCFAALKKRIRHLPSESVVSDSLQTRLSQETLHLGNTRGMFRKCLHTLR